MQKINMITERIDGLTVPIKSLVFWDGTDKMLTEIWKNNMMNDYVTTFESESGKVIYEYENGKWRNQ